MVIPETDAKYYRRRADDEQAAAEAAPVERVRDIHAELARSYRARAENPPAEPPEKI